MAEAKGTAADGRRSLETVESAAAAAKKKKNTRFAFACAMLASMTSILLGYDIGVMSGASIFIKDDLKINDTQVEILLGILNIYSLIGSFAAGRTSDWIGRRYTIVFAAGIFFVGALLMGFATNYAFLMVGRFVAGIGVGYALMIAPVYTAEVAPASSRGFLTSFPEVFINTGILLGYVSNYAFSHFSDHLGWRLMLGVGAVPSVFLALGVLAMPESPRWLIMQGRIGDGRRILMKTSDTTEEAEDRLADIMEAAGIPNEFRHEEVVPPEVLNNKQKMTARHGEGVWKELLIRPTPAVRKIVICALGIHFFQQASGIDAVVLYSPRVFQKAGITEKNKLLLATVAVGFTKTSFILVATFFIDRVGRRPLLLASVGGMVVSLLALASGLTYVDRHQDKKVMSAIAVCIAGILSYVATFSIGLGPITWVYCSEIFPLKLRAQGAAAGVAVNRVTSGVVSMTFLSLSHGITIGGAFFLYAGIAAVAWVFFCLVLPETRGRTLEGMEGLFGAVEKQETNGADKQQREIAGRGDVQQVQMEKVAAAPTAPVPNP